MAQPGPLSTAESLLVGLDSSVHDGNVSLSILPRDSSGLAIREDGQVMLLVLSGSPQELLIASF